MRKTFRQATADMNLARAALSVLPNVELDLVGAVMARTSLPRNLAVWVARFGLQQPSIDTWKGRFNVPVCKGRYIWFGMVDEDEFKAAKLDWDETHPGIFHAPNYAAALRYKGGEVILLVNKEVIIG